VKRRAQNLRGFRRQRPLSPTSIAKFARFPGDRGWQGRCPFAGMMARRKNPHAMALGKLGGLKGGRARAEKLSARRRREIARHAAEARWRPSRLGES
jgi:hypothetical protein